jgi:hypothetical protein
MKYTIEMGSGAMRHVQSFINTSSGLQNLIGEGGQRRTDTVEIAQAYVLFFKIRKLNSKLVQFSN